MKSAKLVTKPASVRDLGPVDIDRLAASIAAIPERFWEYEDAVKDNPFACFHQTQHILFRFVHRDDDVGDFSSKPLWPVWQSLLMPVMQRVVMPYGFAEPAFPKAMLARLRAHGEIKRHRDGPGTNLYTHKIHIPLQTNPRALFEAGDEILHLERGRAYEVNNVDAHAVRNDGDQDRIHFIFEVFDGASGRTALERKRSVDA